MTEISKRVILCTKGLNVRFGGLIALNNVDISVREDEIHGLIGPNGAGKTTFTNAISGLIREKRGEIYFKDKAITSLEPHIIAERGISRTFQKAQIIPGLSCLENVMAGCHTSINTNMLSTLFLPCFLRRYEKNEIKEKARSLIELVGMSGSFNKSGKALSWMECQLLQLARSMAASPRLLILDEPTAGMGLDESRMVGSLIRQIRDTGVTIILISHDMNLVMKNSDRVSVLDFGEKIFEGHPETMKHSSRVLEAYLGTE
ncbi:MAG: ABC transporter ATP-binding protein [Deltaproteobacteria bacterium]|nr:ABC transporter ATP-binding protein [Deltaproteobacteria bacterium]